MRWISAASVVTIVLLASRVAAAQPGMGLTTTTPAPAERPPASERIVPGDRDRGPVPARPGYNPVFLGPTVKGEGTEFGFSGWIAPNDPIGGRVPGGPEVSGWAALGLTFTWGGPPVRPSAGPAAR